MPRIIFTDEELEAVRRYFTCKDIREYMVGRGKGREVPLALADAVADKVSGNTSTTGNPKSKVDAIWQAIQTASR